MATLDWAIIDIVISCKTSYNAEHLAGSFLHVLPEDYALNLHDWCTNIGDPCAVNHASLELIINNCKLDVSEINCISHGVCNSGKAFEVLNANKTNKFLIRMVKYRLCKAVYVHEDKFGKKPIKAGSNQWWTTWELMEG